MEPLLSVLSCRLWAEVSFATAALQTNHGTADTTFLLIPSIPGWGSRVTEMQSGLSKVTRKEMARGGKELGFIGSQGSPVQPVPFGKVLLMDGCGCATGKRG